MNHEAEWVPDKSAPACHRCGTLFTLRKRRHHCRRCGNVVCDVCSQQKQEIQPGAPPKRVCDVCVIFQTPDSFQAPADPRISQYMPLSHNPSILQVAPRFSPAVHIAPSSSPISPNSSSSPASPITSTQTGTPQTPSSPANHHSPPISFSSPHTPLSTNDEPPPPVFSSAVSFLSPVTTGEVFPSVSVESKEPRRTRSASLGAQNDDLVSEFFQDVSEEVARKYNRHAKVTGPKTITKEKQKKIHNNYQTMHSRPPPHIPARPLSPSPRPDPGEYPRPLAKSPEIIRQVIALLASPPGLVYVAQVCDSPFQAPAHQASGNALEELLGKGHQLEFSALPSSLQAQLPALLQAYVVQADYRFGQDAVSDLNAAKVCAAVITDGRFYKTFGGICTVFPALKDLESIVLQLCPGIG